MAFFIDALAAVRHKFDACVSSSEASTARLKGHGVAVLDLNAVEIEQNDADAKLLEEPLPFAGDHEPETKAQEPQSEDDEDVPK